MAFRDDANLRDELSTLTPRLRRYVRALTQGHAGASEHADDLVHATLVRALGARTIGSHADLAIRLYATVTQLNREGAVASRQARAAGAGRPTLVTRDGRASGVPQTRLAAALLAMPLEAREALLLVGCEGFSHADAARILRISRDVLMSRLTRARGTMDTALEQHGSPTQHVHSLPRGRAHHLRLVT